MIPWLVNAPRTAKTLRAAKWQFQRLFVIWVKRCWKDFLASSPLGTWERDCWGRCSIQVHIEILAAQCWLKRIKIYPKIPNCRFQKESSFDPPSRPTPLRHRRSIRLWPSAACRNRIALYCYKSILIYSACGSETSQWLVTDWSFHPMSETQTGPKFCNFRLCVSSCDVFAFLAFCFPFKYWDVCCFYLLARIPVFLDVNWNFMKVLLLFCDFHDCSTPLLSFPHIAHCSGKSVLIVRFRGNNDIQQTKQTKQTKNN